MKETEISNITNTINQFNNAFEFSGLSRLQDTVSELNESIKCSIKPIIELSEQWNKTQKELFGSLKPALDNISEFSKSIRNLPSITSFISPDLLTAFQKYNDVAAPCLYTSSEIIITPLTEFSEEDVAIKEDIQELRLEIKRLHKDLILLRREKTMNSTDFSDEAEYIYSIIYKHYINGTISNHSLMIEHEEFSDDLGDNTFELGLTELQNQRYISDYESYIDGSYRIELCLRCSKALKEGKLTLSEPTAITSIEQKTAADVIIANPPYIQALINNGVILKDMNVVKSLNDVASFIHDNFQEIKITKQLLKQFSHDGKKYSEKKLEEAVTYAYSIDR